MNRWITLIALIAAATAFGARADERAEWTFIVYWCGDCNLEHHMLSDLQAMMQVGSNDDVNLVALVDRHPGDASKRRYSSAPLGDSGNFDGAKTFFVKHGALEELEDLGEVNCGDPAVLTRFVASTIEHYPAKKYALVLRNHGGGWLGACFDETPKDSLSTPELRTALESLSKTAGGPLELVVFDMCLCANLELAHALAPYAKYLAAGEDITYLGNPRYYSFLMARLMADPSMDGAGLARAYVDSYAESWPQSRVNTYSAIDLAAVEPLAEAVGQLAQATLEAIEGRGDDGWHAVAKAQADAFEYGTNNEGSGGYHLVDVIQIAQLLAAEFPDGAVARRAGAVEAAARRAILKVVRGADRPHANGLSIYFPVEETRSLAAWLNTPFGGANAWADMVRAVTGAAAKDEHAPELEGTAVDDVELDESGDDLRITSTVRGTDTDNVRFVLAVMDGEDQAILGSLPIEAGEGGRLDRAWDGKWFMIGDRDHHVLCPVHDWQEVDDADDVYLAEVHMQVRFGGEGEWTNAVVRFRIDMGANDVTGSFESAWDDDGDHPTQLELDDGDVIRPMYEVIDAKGQSTWLPSDDEDHRFTYRDAESIVVNYQRVPAARYKLGFVAEDYSGNTSESYADVQVK